MIRASIGNAVMHSDAPRKIIATSSAVFAGNSAVCRWKYQASAAPPTNGATIPTTDTATALRSFRLTMSVRNSSPTTNM